MSRSSGFSPFHSSNWRWKERTDSNELSSTCITVKSSGGRSSISATSSILSTSRTAPTTWYFPVRSRARAVLRPRPDEVPVTTTSFLSPKSGFGSFGSSGVMTTGRSSALDTTGAAPSVFWVMVVWKEPSRASSTIPPSSLFWTILPARPIVLPTTASTTVPVPPMSAAPTLKPPLPSSSKPSSLRFASCFAFCALVTAPMTTSVGQGDIGWKAGCHEAPVSSVECFHSCCSSSVSTRSGGCAS
mmetsp:Transcript_38843/g.101822  ORF Transcript_38843/g.101822 Transcript_38843/m.101822 type:complete len:244 (-) Transcript_38843:1053-1784(-)